VAESLAALESVARAHAVRLNLIPEGIAPIHGHRETVALALRNVLENAILHGAHPGCVEVRGGRPSAGVDAHERAVDDDVTLHIDDDGPGIPPAERMIVLERFRRRPGMRVPGSGLGLSIAARCMQLHRGAIELGESPRGGLRVTLRFRATRRLATDADAHARNSR
jgi:signal transduction histidine kinase